MDHLGTLKAKSLNLCQFFGHQIQFLHQGGVKARAAKTYANVLARPDFGRAWEDSIQTDPTKLIHNIRPHVLLIPD
jgi:hypothetical protein